MRGATTDTTEKLIDGFGREITYLRLSVTDRCDLRCRYCMSEKMTFLPRREILSLEEIEAIASVFIERGVRKIRLTGGEPLARRGIISLANTLGQHVRSGALDELTLTTNATRLAEFAAGIAETGIKRINVSLDSRDPERFRYITRHGQIDQVLEGIAAAKAVGLKIKINMVALKGLNDDEILPMLRWCASEGHELTLIETMPLGYIDEDRTDRYLPLDAVREKIAAKWSLSPTSDQTGGPARYEYIAELDTKIGFITPLSNNFCAGCNRVRLTVKGELFLCLGQNEKVDLRAALREGGRDAVHATLANAMQRKPLRHEFDISQPNATPAVERHMSVTGG